MEETILLLRKFNPNLHSNTNIPSKITEAFENADTYFRRTIQGNKIIIGKKFSQLKEEELKHKITLIKNHSRNSFNLMDLKEKMIKSVSLPLLKINQKVDTKHQITDAELYQIFDRFKLNTKRNSQLKSNNAGLIDQFTPKQFKQLLFLQEETLKKREQQNKISINIKKHIQRKTNKAPEALLLNRIASFRNIQEIKNKTGEILINERNWDLSLRYDDGFTGKKRGHTNIGSKEKPQWVILNEQTPKIEERVRNVSERESPEHKSFLSNPYLRENREYNSIQKSFSNLQGLSVIGKGLLELELENIKMIKGKKKLVNPGMSHDSVQPKEFIKNLTYKHLLSVKTISNCRNLHQQ